MADVIEREEPATLAPARAEVTRTFGEDRPTYFVFGEGQNAPVQKHGARRWAIREAQRLAGKYPNVRFHVVKVKDTFEGGANL